MSTLYRIGLTAYRLRIRFIVVLAEDSLQTGVKLGVCDFFSCTSYLPRTVAIINEYACVFAAFLPRAQREAQLRTDEVAIAQRVW